MVKVAAYTSPLRMDPTPTGVGQHIHGMFSALQQRDDVLFSLISPRGTRHDADGLIASHARSRLVPLPLPDRLLRMTTTWASLVNVDPWLQDEDWVYAPVEQPVTTRRRLAVTVHDLYPFEPTVAGIPDKRTAGISWRRRLKRILERANVIATVSDFTRSRMLDLFDVRHPERIVVVGNGGSEGFDGTVRPDDERVLARYGLKPGFILFPASLTWKKGGDLLLRVAMEARAQGMSLEFAVTGRRHDADLLTRMRQLDDGAGLPVTLLGYVAKHELAAMYRRAAATLVLSRYEGFGIPVVEALASGCPLFISKHAALMEVAAGQGILVDDDPGCILTALVNHRPPAASCSRPNWAASSHHTWANSAAKLVSALQ